MKNYLHWSLRQLYLIFFWPTQFKREFEGKGPSGFKQNSVKTVRYLVGMLPLIATITVLVNAIVGSVFELRGIHFNWTSSWVHMLWVTGKSMVLGPVGLIALPAARAAGFEAAALWIGIAVGVAFFAIAGMARGVSVIVASGVAFGPLLGVLLVLDTPTTGLVLMFFTVLGALLSLGFGAAFNVASGLKLCAAFGVVFGLSYSVGKGWNELIQAPLWAGFLTLGVFRLGVYPFDVALTVITYLVGRWQPRATAWAWRHCPVAWNELIWAPMPLAGKLLAMLAKQDRAECFRQIAFVAAERKLQRRVALAAMKKIVLNDLKANTIVEMADITNKISWTRGSLGNELTATLAGVVAALDQVAQHAGQYLMLHNSYRKGEVLRRAADEIQSIQFRLIAHGELFSQQLLRVVNRWRAVIEAEGENLRKLTAVALEIPNPFVFGNPVMATEHNIFSGRNDIVKQIEASVFGTRQAPTLLLYGPRRVGKTSILHQLPRLLGSDFAPAICDCQNPAVVESEVMLLHRLSRTLSEGLGLRRVHIEPLTAEELARMPFSTFDEWLDAVEIAMPGRMRALLCLDEYERLQDTLELGWGGKLLDALRHTIQHRPRIVLMFTGTRTFQELGPEWTGRFINARRVRISFLQRDEVDLLLRSPIPKFNMTYATGALDAVIAATNCQPFLTQAVAFELVQLLNQQKQTEATPDDVETAVTRALDSGGVYFAYVWYESGEQGQAILRAIARGETPPTFRASRAWLQAQDVLNDKGEFAVEMMRRWVKTNSS